MGTRLSPLLISEFAVALPLVVTLRVFGVGLVVGAVFTLAFLLLPTFVALSRACIVEGPLFGAVRALISFILGCFKCNNFHFDCRIILIERVLCRLHPPC